MDKEKSHIGGQMYWTYLEVKREVEETAGYKGNGFGLRLGLAFHFISTSAPPGAHLLCGKFRCHFDGQFELRWNHFLFCVN